MNTFADLLGSSSDAFFEPVHLSEAISARVKPRQDPPLTERQQSIAFGHALRMRAEAEERALDYRVRRRGLRPVGQSPLVPKPPPSPPMSRFLRPSPPTQHFRTEMEDVDDEEVVDDADMDEQKALAFAHALRLRAEAESRALDERARQRGPRPIGDSPLTPPAGNMRSAVEEPASKRAALAPDATIIVAGGASPLMSIRAATCTTTPDEKPRARHLELPSQLPGAEPSMDVDAPTPSTSARSRASSAPCAVPATRRRPRKVNESASDAALMLLAAEEKLPEAAPAYQAAHDAAGHARRMRHSSQYVPSSSPQPPRTPSPRVAAAAADAAAQGATARIAASGNDGQNNDESDDGAVRTTPPGALLTPDARDFRTPPPAPMRPSLYHRPTGDLHKRGETERRVLVTTCAGVEYDGVDGQHPPDLTSVPVLPSIAVAAPRALRPAAARVRLPVRVRRSSRDTPKCAWTKTGRARRPSREQPPSHSISASSGGGGSGGSCISTGGDAGSSADSLVVEGLFALPRARGQTLGSLPALLS